MSMSRFIVSDNNVETDWIDPVYGVRETVDAWLVDSAADIYMIPKISGRTVSYTIEGDLG